METILVIDDSQGIRDSLRRTLELKGFTVLTAANGNEGLKIFKDKRIDIVITDMLMPEKDGLKTIMEMRKLSKGIKIIAMSGGGRVGPDEYLRLAEHLDVSHTLTKPFQKEELLRAVRELLKSDE